MELDHILIATKPGAPEAETLKRFGLTEGSSNVHPGQGTANRRFFFRNAYIELIWLNNADEAQSELTRPTLLHQRLTAGDDIVSPFGVCFRPTNSTECAAPFPNWSYRPTYLPSGRSVDIGEPVTLLEPMWFFLSWARRPDAEDSNRMQPLTHATNFREITSVLITIPGTSRLSAAARIATESSCVRIYRHGNPKLVVGFDGCLRGETHDFSPILPIVFQW